MEDKCDIIDIADEEMKKIDSTEIDEQIQKIMKKEYFDRIITIINEGTNPKQLLKEYKIILNNKNILDIRTSGKCLFIKTTKINKKTLAQTMNIPQKIIDSVPIHGKYNFYFINTYKINPKTKKHEKPTTISDLLWFYLL